MVRVSGSSVVVVGGVSVTVSVSVAVVVSMIVAVVVSVVAWVVVWVVVAVVVLVLVVVTVSGSGVQPAKLHMRAADSSHGIIYNTLFFI
jgi:hypothetical protein